jgi:hypothetical protein
MNLLDRLAAAGAPPTREQLDALGFADVRVRRSHGPNVEALALAVCDWLRERGETYRYDEADTAHAWVHLFIGEICDEIAMKSGVPAEYAAAARKVATQP